VLLPISTHSPVAAAAQGVGNNSHPAISPFPAADLLPATAGVTDKAAELAGAASKATSNVTESAAAAAAGLTSAVSGATSSVTGALSGIGSGVSSNVQNLKSSLGQGVSGITSQVRQGHDFDGCVFCVWEGEGR
jgi:hypothetical protein